jgi:hypothetical protein
VSLRTAGQTLGQTHGQTHGQPTEVGPRLPPLVMLAVVAAAGFWAVTAHMLAGSQVYAHYNLAFDFDPLRYINLLTINAEAWSALDAAAEFWVKHPLYLLHRPLVQALMAVGVSPLWAVLSLSILLGVLSLLVFDQILRCLELPSAIRAAGVLVVGASATQIACIVVPDAYAAALLGILLAIWMVMSRAAAPAGWPVQRFMLPVYLFGVTATNLVFAAMAEFAIQVTTQPLVQALRNLVIWGVVSGVVIVAVLVAVYPSDMMGAASDPIQALKSVLWIGSLAPDKSIPPAGLLTMLETVFAFSLSAPAPSVVMIQGAAATLPQIPMQDFRVFDYSAVGLAALLGWLALLGLGAIGLLRGLRTRQGLAIAMALGLMLAFNLAFHLYFQYRGSVFLYAGHFFPPVAVVAAVGIGQLHRLARSQELAIALAILVLALLNAANNFAQMDAVRAGIVAGGY